MEWSCTPGSSCSAHSACGLCDRIGSYARRVHTLLPPKRLLINLCSASFLLVLLLGTVPDYKANTQASELLRERDSTKPVLVLLFPRFLCAHCCSVVTVPLCLMFLFAYCSSAPTVALFLLLLCTYCFFVLIGHFNYLLFYFTIQPLSGHPV